MITAKEAILAALLGKIEVQLADPDQTWDKTPTNGVCQIIIGDWLFGIAKREELDTDYFQCVRVNGKTYGSDECWSLATVFTRAELKALRQLATTAK